MPRIFSKKKLTISNTYTDQEGNELSRFTPSKVDHQHMQDIKNYLKHDSSLKSIRSTTPNAPNDYVKKQSRVSSCSSKGESNNSPVKNIENVLKGLKPTQQDKLMASFEAGG